MTNRHSTALVSPDARIADDVTIGPFCVIEHGVEIGRRCRLSSHVVVKQGTTLGSDNVIEDSAVLGGRPQHVSAPAVSGRLIVGNGNTIREACTLHCGLKEDDATVVGDGNYLMVNVHLGHDSHIANRTIVCNNTMIAGHVSVDDGAFVSGAVAVHQFCRIGRFAMVGGQAHVTRDVPPFVTVDGASTTIVGLNAIGLRRNGFSRDDLAQLKEAYRIIYRRGLRWADVVPTLRREFTSGPALVLAEFLSGGQRGFTPERRTPRGATLRFRRPDEDDVRSAEQVDDSDVSAA